MSDTNSQCARCGGKLEEGFFYGVDAVGEAGIGHPSGLGWMAGEAIRHEGGFFTKRVANPTLALTALRCTTCGLTELFAR